MYTQTMVPLAYQAYIIYIYKRATHCVLGKGLQRVRIFHGFIMLAGA
jgi:hypothetical protein